MTQEYFIGSWVNPYGNKYKLMRVGRRMDSPIRLYVNGVKVAHGSQAECKQLGRTWKGDPRDYNN